MTDASSSSQISDDFEILVKRKDGDTYNLHADGIQLEKLGTLLRGKPKFSVINVIIIPIIVTIATLLVTSLFQYFSWVNSVRLDKATGRATRAANLYQTVATAIAERHYATLLFIPAAQAIAKSQNIRFE